MLKIILILLIISIVFIIKLIIVHNKYQLLIFLLNNKDIIKLNHFYISNFLGLFIFSKNNIYINTFLE